MSCHCRDYERKGKVLKGMLTLYLTPTAPGASRVLVTYYTQPGVKRGGLFPLFPTWLLHLLDLAVLDGDSYFLHAQEKLLAQKGARAEEYNKVMYLPTSADRFVHAFRQWFAKHGGGKVEWAPGVNGELDTRWAPREAVMDRFMGHTRHCMTCSKALGRAQTASKALYAATFALLALAAALRVAPVVRFGVAAGALAAFGLSLYLNKFTTYFTYRGYDHATR
eukprot:SM000003S11182  [mRNA]  locus=s3:1429327:1430422:- [translate_table: standard]